jgi:type II secretion system protein N
MGLSAATESVSAPLQFLRFKPTVAWHSYVIAATLVCSALMFPYDLLQSRLLDALSRRCQMTIRAGQWSFVLPAGLAWHGVSVSRPNSLPLMIDRVELRVDLLSLLRGRPIFESLITFNGGAPAGEDLLKVAFALQSWSLHGPADLTGHFELLDMARFPWIRAAAGRLNGQFTHRWTIALDEQEFLRGDGAWQIEMTDVVLNPAGFESLLGPQMSLSKLQGRLTCAGGSCRIDNLEGAGADGMVTGEGTVVLQVPFDQSLLTASLSLTPSEALRRRVPGIAFFPKDPFEVTLAGPLSHLAAAHKE